MSVLWLEDIGADDVAAVGGKGASLGELATAGLPVPPAFVVTAETYRNFIEEAGIDEELFAAVDVDVDDSDALARAERRARELIRNAPFPDGIREEILRAHGQLRGDDEGVFVAVRSSATAEDLPDASFAGQQETFLNVSEEAVLERVRDCWASLFTQRAIYYRQEQGFSHEDVNMAVVVQRMVDAEKSGVMFTSHPSTGDPRMIIEAAWGLGEAVVSGSVSPDNYVADREGGLEEVTVADKKVMHVRNDDGETEEQAVPEDRREERVLSAAEVDDLVELGERVEDHYDTPQDVEWAIAGGEIFMLQSRPITTIQDGAIGEADDTRVDPDVAMDTAANGNGEDHAEAGEAGVTDGSGVEAAEGEGLVRGLGASPGRATGPVRVVRQLDQLDKVGKGDVIVTEMSSR